jgi:hypothetical protein
LGALILLFNTIFGKFEIVFDPTLALDVSGHGLLIKFASFVGSRSSSEMYQNLRKFFKTKSALKACDLVDLFAWKLRAGLP